MTLSTTIRPSKSLGPRPGNLQSSPRLWPHCPAKLQAEFARGNPHRAGGRIWPTGRGILVVDDEPSVRGFLQVVLRQQGFTVWLAADGHDAIRLYQRHREQIALVLLDVRMPGLNGPQTLAAIQELDPGVVCCFMTGEAGNYTEWQLEGAGALRVFAKPFALAELRAYLGRLALHEQGCGS